MVGAAVLDMASLDESDSEFNATMEKAIKMMSMANLLDHSNAMVQNHLANHYFWKWTPIPGSATVEHGSKLVVGTQPIPLDPGERIRIGTDFETYVAEDVDDDEEGKSFRMKDEWKEATTSEYLIDDADKFLLIWISSIAFPIVRWTESMEEGLRPCRGACKRRLQQHECEGYSS